MTTNIYDAMDRLVSTTDPKNQRTQMAYDSADNLITLTDANNHALQYSYDQLNRKIRMTYPDSSFEQWSYDGAGNLSRYTVRNGATRTSVYDVRNRTISSTWSDSTPAVAATYDYSGRVLTRSSTVSALSYIYDDANELLSEQQVITGQPSALTVAYTYDLDGNRASLTNPDGTIVQYTYTNRNQVHTITGGGVSGSTTYIYDLAGNRVTKSLPNGIVTSYGYDNANRLLTVNHQHGSTPLAGYAYAYNTVNDRTSRTETINGLSTPQNYTYDAIDQVTSASYGTSRTQGFSYDPVGNRIQATDTTPPSPVTYTANNLNQYTALSSQPTALSYDTNGNLTTNNGWTYGYDSQNRLINAANGSISETLAYDAGNRCVRRTLNGVSTFLIYDGWNLIGEYDATGTLQAKYVNGSWIDENLVKVTFANTVYYHQDGLGSVVALSDSTGNVLERYSYYVYGKVGISNAGGSLLISSAYGNRFLFTGREFLAELILYDCRNRFYSPDLGRWLSRDPLPHAEKSQGLNLYAYVGNNPILNFDPYGTCNCTQALVEKSLILMAAANWQAESAIYWPNYLPGKTNDCGAQAEELLNYLNGLGLSQCWNASLDYGERWPVYPVIGGSHNVIEFDPRGGGLSSPNACCKDIYPFTLDPYAGNNLSTLLTGYRGPVGESTPRQFFQNFPYNASTGN